MTGPMPRGHWMTHVKPASWDMLHPGHRYRVSQAFRDYDHFDHAVGETWTYLGSAFLPYDDGLSLFVSLDGAQEWHIRMQMRPEEQGPILNNLQQYLIQLPSDPAPPPPPPAPQRTLKAPFTLLGVSLLAVVLAFFLFMQSENSPHFVAPGGASILYALFGFIVGALGLLGGVIAVIWIAVRGSRTHA